MDLFDNTRRGLVFEVGHTYDLATKRFNSLTFYQLSARAISSFYMHMRPQDLQTGNGSQVIVNKYRIDRSHRRDDLRSLASRVDGSSRSFVPAHRAIRIDTDDQHVAVLFCIRKVADMTNVNDVECPVARNYPLACRLGFAHHFYYLPEREYPRMKVFQSVFF